MLGDSLAVDILHPRPQSFDAVCLRAVGGVENLLNVLPIDESGRLLGPMDPGVVPEEGKLAANPRALALDLLEELNYVLGIHIALLNVVNQVPFSRNSSDGDSPLASLLRRNVIGDVIAWPAPRKSQPIVANEDGLVHLEYEDTPIQKLLHRQGILTMDIA